MWRLLLLCVLGVERVLRVDVLSTQPAHASLAYAYAYAHNTHTSTITSTSARAESSREFDSSAALGNNDVILLYALQAV